jgi:hypothetical protein
MQKSRLTVTNAEIRLLVINPFEHACYDASRVKPACGKWWEM